MLTFLHLSDLHFTMVDAGTPFDRDVKIREALLADLGQEGRTNFDGIFVTGDISYHGRAEEFTRAKSWFEEIRKATNSSPEAIFVIPGNHDVNRAVTSKDSPLWELHQSLRRDMPTEDRFASLDKKLQDDFDFLTPLLQYRSFAAEFSCPTSPKQPAWVQFLDDKHSLEDGTIIRIHGLNSAVISDQEDRKANLLLGLTQFHHFSSEAGYVNIVLCHHPHTWLIDGNESNDFFRNQAQLVLSGHDHDARTYMEGESLRVFAGAVHPNPREARWEPCYHVIRLSIKNEKEKRILHMTVETRVWRDKDKCFGPQVTRDGESFFEKSVTLSPWRRTVAPPISDSKQNPVKVESSSTMTELPLSSDAFAAARRRLIVHFFRLGTISRYEAVIKAAVWDESDDAFDGQERWARVFERAEKSGKLGDLWDTVAAKDDTLSDQPNPFTTK